MGRRIPAPPPPPPAAVYELKDVVPPAVPTVPEVAAAPFVSGPARADCIRDGGAGNQRHVGDLRVATTPAPAAAAVPSIVGGTSGSGTTSAASAAADEFDGIVNDVPIRGNGPGCAGREEDDCGAGRSFSLRRGAEEICPRKWKEPL